MKILILNYEFPPMGGGAGSATYNVAKELALLGHQVDVLTSKLPGNPKKELIAGFRVFRVFSWRKGIHDCGFRGALSYVFFTIPYFITLVRRENYDVLHYFFGLPTGFLSLLPGKHTKIPYVISLRGSDVPFYDAYNGSLQWVHRPLIPFTKRIWHRAKRVVALSKSLKTTALKTNEDQRIDVIPNGIESDIFKRQDRAGAEHKGKSFQLITVSRLIERKGIQHVLHALAKLKNKDISLLIVGTGNYEKQLKILCDQLSLNEIVTFYGYCPREALPKLLSTGDAFILPSLAESFGMVFIEAMACGLPIIAGRVGGVPDFVHPENGILVDPENIDEIKDAILNLKNDRSMREAMTKANRIKAVQDYNWKNVAEKYLDIYQD
jgi:glycosyltransferase involved in cell wall biosynthesis